MDKSVASRPTVCSLSVTLCAAMLACSSSDEPSHPAPETSLTVVFSPSGGTFVGSESVSLSVKAPAEIHYTLDGTLPTASSPLYTAPLVLDESTRIRAFALAKSAASVAAVTPSAGAGGSADDAELRGAVASESYLRVSSNAQAFSSHLPILVLHTFEAGKLDPKGSEFVSANLEVLEPSAGKTQLVGRATLDARVGIHVRGATSRNFEKKQYALELRGDESDDDSGQALLGLPRESDFVLSDPISMDRTLIRNALAYAISNRIGRYAPRTRFAEVFLVDDGGDVRSESFLGFYTVIEKVKRDAERVNVSKLPASASALPEISGGFVLKIDKGQNDFQAAGKELQFVYPKPEEMKLTTRKPQLDYIKSFLDGFGQALNATDFRNPSTGQHYSEYIDVDAFIDHDIINALTKNVDALRISTFFSKERDEPLAAGPVWDFDRSLGTPYEERARAPEEWKKAGSDGTDYLKEGWWGGLFRDPQFKARYRDRFKALLHNELSADNLDAMVDSLVAEVGAAAARNFERWSNSQPKDGSHAAEVAILKDFLRRRVRWLETQLDTAF